MWGVELSLDVGSGALPGWGEWCVCALWLRCAGFSRCWLSCFGAWALEHLGSVAVARAQALDVQASVVAVLERSSCGLVASRHVGS